MYKTLSKIFLQKLSLSQTNADHSIFLRKIGLNGQIVNTFVYDIKIIALKGIEIIQCIKIELTATFLIIDIGLISFYLSLKVE